MPTPLAQIKTELIRRFKLAQASREKKLTFNYFQKIADYIDWVEKHKELKKIIDNETNSFQQYFLVKRGWNIDSAKQKLGDEEEGDFNHAYLNLFNVYLAVEDLDLTDKDEDDPDNYYLSHRIKSAKQLAKIRDSYKIVGYSYFCFHKEKYADWLKTVHEKILAELAFTEIEESKNNNTQKQENNQPPIIPTVEISLNIKREKEPIKEKVKPKFKVKNKQNDEEVDFVKKLKLTEDSEWKDIQIKFLNEFDLETTNLKNKKSFKTTHSDLGFGDKRAEKSGKTKAIKSYKFFQTLAINKGIFPFSQTAIGSKEREDRAEDKKKIANTLKDKFPIIYDDPFEKFNKFNSKNEDYKIKLKLIPAPDFRDWDFKDQLKGITEQNKSKSKEDKKNDEFILDQKREAEIRADEEVEKERKKWENILNEQAPQVYEE